MTSAPSPDPLRLSNCPGCGYALEGLASEGSCPECGGHYDQSEVVLHGFCAGQHTDVATARPAVAVVAAVALAFMGSWFLRDWFRSGRRDHGDLLWAAFVVAWVLWGLWKRFATDMPGLVQVRLGAWGALQVNNPTAQGRKAGKPTPWRDVADASIAPDRDGTVRIKVERRKSFWRGSPTPVDAEVDCTPEQAAALRERVAAWRAAAWNEGASAPAAGAASDSP